MTFQFPLLNAHRLLNGFKGRENCLALDSFRKEDQYISPLEARPQSTGTVGY